MGSVPVAREGPDAPQGQGGAPGRFGGSATGARAGAGGGRSLGGADGEHEGHDAAPAKVRGGPDPSSDVGR
jgi:hypothetical protein